jgi:4-hydroxy-3-polyprenylbenzoate decarboxylase
MDHAGGERGVGKQVGIDATRKWREEGYPGEWPGRLAYPQEILDQVERRWEEYRVNGW